MNTTESNGVRNGIELRRKRVFQHTASFRGPVKWFAICNVQLLKDDDTLRIVSAETYLDSAVTNSIEEICVLVDEMMVQERPIVPSQQTGVSNGVAL